MESAFTDWTHLQYSCRITASLTVHSIQIHGQVLANISNNNTHRQSRELEKKRTYQIIYSLQLAVKNSFTLNPISMWFVLALIVGITLAWLSFTPCAGWYPRQHSAGVSLQVPLLGGQNSHLFFPHSWNFALIFYSFPVSFIFLHVFFYIIQPLLLLNPCCSSTLVSPLVDRQYFPYYLTLKIWNQYTKSLPAFWAVLMMLLTLCHFPMVGALV